MSRRRVAAVACAVGAAALLSACGEDGDTGSSPGSSGGASPSAAGVTERLFVTRLVGDAWSDPEPIESVNTSGDEYHPSFAPDGTSMFFVRRGDLLEVDLPAELGP